MVMFGLHFLVQTPIFFLLLKMSVFFPLNIPCFLNFYVWTVDWTRLSMHSLCAMTSVWLDVWKYFWYFYVVTDPLLSNLCENTTVKNHKPSVRIGSGIVMLNEGALIISCCKSEHFHQFQLNFTCTSRAF